MIPKGTGFRMDHAYNSMIPKSGNRFSVQIMLKAKRSEHDSILLNRIMF